MSLLIDFARPIVRMLGVHQVVEKRQVAIASYIRGRALEAGLPLPPDPLVEAVATDLARARDEAEIIDITRKHASALGYGAALGVGPIESPPRPHAAGAPASTPVAVADAALCEHDEDEHDIDHDTRMAWRRSQAAAAPLAPYVSPFGGLGMAGTVPGEPDTWQKVKYVSYGVLGTGVVVCVIYTFVRAIGWIIERLYYPPRRRAWGAVPT